MNVPNSSIANLVSNSRFTQEWISKASINTLPKELLKEIYKFLPAYDQVIFVPFVCKKWLTESITSIFFQTSLNALFANFADKDSVSHIPNSNKKLLKLILRNNIILELAKTNITFYSFDPWGKTVIGTTSFPSKIICKEYRSLSEFKLNWNSRTSNFGINNSGKWGEMRTTYNLHILKRCFLDPSTEKVYGLTFDLLGYSRFFTEKGNFFTWERFPIDDIGEIIDYALLFELKNHIKRITDSNFENLSQVKTIEDISSKLYCHCDNVGRIHEVNATIENIYSKNYRNFDLSIKKFTEPKSQKTFPFLIWETSDLNLHDLKGHEKITYKFSMVLRWLVLSNTAERIAEKLGIAIKQEELG